MVLVVSTVPVSTASRRPRARLAVMVAIQAELIWRRAQPLGARASDKTAGAA
jgi:hypothetical protein